MHTFDLSDNWINTVSNFDILVTHPVTLMSVLSGTVCYMLNLLMELWWQKEGGRYCVTVNEKEIKMVMRGKKDFSHRKDLVIWGKLITMCCFC